MSLAAPAPDPLNMPQNRAMAEVLAHIGKLGIGALGAGAAIRGFQGLGDLVSGTMSAPPKMPIHHQVIDVPVRRLRPPVEEEAPPRRQLPKLAADLPPANLPTQMAGGVLKSLGAFSPNMSDFGKMMWNPTAQHWYQHPWAIPAAFTAVAGGGLAGHHLMGKALDASKANEDDSELNMAKQRYERALGGGIGKMATADDVGAILDRIYDRLEPAMQKAATFNDAIGPMLGGAAIPLGLTALGSGIVAYNWNRDRSDDNVVAKAIKTRRERLYSQQPPVLMAIPRPAMPHHKQSALPPGVAVNQAMARIRAMQDGQRQRLMAAFGHEPPKAESKPTEPKPYQPPSMANSQ